VIIAVDFDGTVVSQEHPYDELETPLTFLPGAQEALLSLKRAGHVLLLYSARSNLALRVDWRRNPVWVARPDLFDRAWWQAHRPLAEARYQQMLDFVQQELPGVFDAIDDGSQGKPTGVGLFLDDRAFGWSYTGGWEEVQYLYGEPPEDATETAAAHQEVRRGP